MPELSYEELKALKAAFISEPEAESPRSPMEAPKPGGLRILVRESLQKWSGQELTGLEVAMKKTGDYLERSFVALSRKPCKVKFQAMDITDLEEGVFSLPEGFYAIVIALNPIVGKVALVMEPWLAFFLTYALLGGGPPKGIDRPINPLEGEVLYDALAERVEESLLSGFKDLVSLTPKAEGFRTRPQTLYICDPKESVAIGRYRASIGQEEGERACEVMLIAPLRPFEGMRRLLVAPYHGDSNASVKEALRNELIKVPLEITAELDNLPMTLGSLFRLTQGDVVLLGRSAEDYRAALAIEGVKKFKGSFGKKGEMRAVCIQKRIEG